MGGGEVLVTAFSNAHLSTPSMSRLVVTGKTLKMTNLEFTGLVSAGAPLRLIHAYA